MNPKVIVTDQICEECEHDLARHVLVMHVATLYDDGSDASKIGSLDCSDCECKMEI